MRIGIDAKWFFDGPPSNKRVIRNLVLSICLLHGRHTIVLFLDKKHKNKPVPIEANNVELVYIWAKNNLLSNISAMPIAANNNHVDILISQNFVPFFGRFKKILYIHDVIFKSHPEYFTKTEIIYFWFMKPLARFADTICTISFSEKNRLLKYQFAKRSEDIHVVYHGIESQFSIPKERTIIYEEIKKRYSLPKKYMLYVGRLNQRKNIYNLLKAFSLIPSPRLPLVLVGAADRKMFNIYSVLKELNIQESVMMVGFVSDTDLPAIYSLATLFCYVSFEEGFGLPPLESMASGVPVIVANSSSLPEVCGDAAEYVDPHDPKDIARGIVHVLNDKQRYSYLVSAGKERASRYRWDVSAKEIMSISESLFVGK